MLNIESEDVLQRTIGYRFREPKLLHEALTHKSYYNEHRETAPRHNERLEFLGDAVLDLAVSRRIFDDYPEYSEGELTRIRAEVVSENGLAEVGRKLGLGQWLRLGRGEERSGGRQKASLVSDALEAVIGAVFCDGGLMEVEKLVERLFAQQLKRSALRKKGIDHKTRLQEVMQAAGGKPPIYRLVSADGPDHQRVYRVEVVAGKEILGCGSGQSKKKAEQEAARQALIAMGV